MRSDHVLAAILSATAFAAPGEISQSVDAKDSRQEIDRFAKLATAAYCQNVRTGKPGHQICTNKIKNACDGISYLNTTAEFSTKGLLGLYGVDSFMALDTNKNEVLVSFRGTEITRVQDLINDAAFWPSAIPYVCENCYVHQGFKSVYEANKDEMVKMLMAYRAQYPNLRIVTTGHSLGGAAATILAADLRSRGIPCDLYTFGSPRVGNDKFASFVESKSPKLGINARVTNKVDFVTTQPPQYVAGYYHTFPEYWYDYGTRGANKQQPIFDPALRANGRPGCVSQSQCSSSNCVTGWLSYFNCSLEDHRLTEYTDNFDACPAMSGKRHESDIPTMEELQGYVDRMLDEIRKARANGTYPIDAQEAEPRPSAAPVVLTSST